MDFPFPPPPPDYLRVIVARSVLVVWAVVGVGVLAARVHRWKAIRPPVEAGRWVLAAAISFITALFGVCRYPVYDNNAWLTTVTLAAISASIAGVFVCFCKVYLEGTADEKMRWIGEITAATIVVGMVWMVSYNPLAHPKEARDRVECKNNLKHIGLAMHNYHDEYHTFPASVAGNPRVSWRVSILPLIEQGAVFSRYNRTTSWDQPPNSLIAHDRIPLLICPSSLEQKDAGGRWYTAYSLLTGSHSIGENPRGTKISEITDGTSNTLLVVEACGAQIVWTEPRDVDRSIQSTGINLPGDKPGHSRSWLSSYHHQGTHALLADGSVRFVSDATAPEVLNKLATIDGGEDPGDF